MLLLAITNMLETKQSLRKETEEKPNGYLRDEKDKMEINSLADVLNSRVEKSEEAVNWKTE